MTPMIVSSVAMYEHPDHAIQDPGNYYHEPYEETHLVLLKVAVSGNDETSQQHCRHNQHSDAHDPSPETSKQPHVPPSWGGS